MPRPSPPHPTVSSLAAALVSGALVLAGCAGGDKRGVGDTTVLDASDVPDATVDDTDAVESDSDDEAAPFEWPEQIAVTVTLDGAPVANAVVMQGGAATHTETDALGRATVAVDTMVVGQLAVVASHREARVGSVVIDRPPSDAVTIALTRYAADDPEYPWQDPGEPRRSPNTAQCGHCHETLVADWYGSPHRTSARSRVVNDVYAGTAAGLDSEPTCVAAGGEWLDAPGPGGGPVAARCFIGVGTLPDLNDCANRACTDATDYGDCSSCHAPAMGPTLGGHDLRAATGLAYDYGVFCDVCHRVDRVEPGAGPGVAGSLVLTRPSEVGPAALGPRLPLTFGPSHDSPNPRMGSVQRDHYRDGTLCAGCHQLEDGPPPGQALDSTRWPSGNIPIATTYQEWAEGPLAEAAVCNDCHMPPASEVLNGGDLQLNGDVVIGVPGGWYRAPGSVRHHSWVGPRAASSRLLELAASLSVHAERGPGGDWDVAVTTRNVGAGHAIPTGETFRSLILTVSASCGGVPLGPVGGDVVSSLGGADEVRVAGDGWDVWPNAAVGDVFRVVVVDDGWVDYDGFGPFGDGTFAADAKGLRVERLAGVRVAVAVDAAGVVTFDAPLPDGDRVYRAAGPRALAGSPGWVFARVLGDASGATMVPHHRAVDVVSDNRLLPQQSWISHHVFDGACEAPVFTATLIHRRYPLELERERSWPEGDRLVTMERR
ncbi:MAG: hypothetical protein H6699_12095 [Myxococcales bacterium]|nr:hypothetical protein [Myxococcales bacterium]